MQGTLRACQYRTQAGARGRTLQSTVAFDIDLFWARTVSGPLTRPASASKHRARVSRCEDHLTTEQSCEYDLAASFCTCFLLHFISYGRHSAAPHPLRPFSRPLLAFRKRRTAILCIFASDAVGSRGHIGLDLYKVRAAHFGDYGYGSGQAVFFGFVGASE
jgi:hypothetical protein